MAKTPNLKGCMDTIQEVANGLLSKEQSEALVKALEQKAANMKLGKVEENIAKAGEELIDDMKRIALLEKRNALMSVIAVRNLKKYAATYTNAYDGFLALLENSRRSISGAGHGVDAVIEGYKGRYLGELKARLLKEDVLDDYMHDNLEKEIFQEFYNPGSSGSEKAGKIRDIMFALKQDMVEKQNLYGSFIHFLPEHVKKQTYNVNLIKKAFGPDRFKNLINFKRDLTPEEYNQTFEGFKNFLMPLLDAEKTFKDSTPENFLRGVFDGVMSGKHGPIEHADGYEINAGFFQAGALAEKASVQRLLHFKDGESAYSAHKTFSNLPLSGGFRQEIEHGATNLGLMQMLGPNPSEALDEAISQTEYELSRKGEMANLRRLQENKHKLFGALSFLDRSASIPENPTLHTAVATTISWLSTAKLGKLFLFAMPDRALIQSVLTRNGVRGLDALAATFKMTKPATEDERLRLIMMGAELKSFIGAVGTKFQTGAEGFVPPALANSQKWFFHMTGINWIDDIGTRSVVGTLPRHLGVNADRSWEAMNPELRHVLDLYGINSKEWDAWRSTVYSIDKSGNIVEGKIGDDNWITPDRFDKIPDSTIDSLLDDRGIKVSDNTRARQRNELVEKFHTWLTAQRDEGVLMPGSKEHRLAAFGTQAGTASGSVFRLLMMFKSFPITVYTKILQREMYGNGARTFSDWLASEKNSNFHTTQLVAMLTIAGYLSLTLDELIQGREPRKFQDSQGNLDVEHSALLLKDSFLRGGAGSLYADFLLREYDQGYKNIARTLGGPVVNEAMKVTALFSQGIQGKARGQDAIDFVRGNTPWVNMFYVKPALDYLIFWNMQEGLTPGALRAHERRIETDYNQDYWLKPSDAVRK